MFCIVLQANLLTDSPTKGICKHAIFGICDLERHYY